MTAFLTAVASPEAAFVLVIRIGAVGVLLTSIELIVDRRLLWTGGLMSWTVGQVRRRYLVHGLTGAAFDWLLRYPNVLGMLALRAALAAVILFGPDRLVLGPILVPAIALLLALFTLRNPYGLDGADQMFLILFVGGALPCLDPNPFTRTIYLWFVAFQACLSYTTAGIAKATAGGWWDGSYLTGVFATRMYGAAGFARALRKYPPLAKTLSLALITWESLFPLSLIAPEEVTAAFLIVGCGFHVANAFLMGLNTFLWAFLATYPAIVFCVRSRGW